MDNTEFANEITAALDAKLNEKPAQMDNSKYAAAPYKPRLDANTRPATPTLAEDWETHRSIGAALRTKLHVEQRKLLTDHDRAWLDLRHRYEERIAQTIADMKAELDSEQRRLVAAYQAKARELDLLAQRIGEETV
jgi:uncharacterized NAD(P)/FAD-binding protein YdhS